MDVKVDFQGSLALFHLLTPVATALVKENVQGDAQFFGNALVVEPRYADSLIYGMAGDGLDVET